jgi:heme exporter protein D
MNWCRFSFACLCRSLQRFEQSKMKMDNSTQRKNTDSFLHLDSRWVVIGGTIVSAIILFLLFLSMGTAYATGKRLLAQQYQPIPVATDVELKATFPEHVLLDTPPKNLVLGLSVGETANFTFPLTVTINTPSSIAINGSLQSKKVFTTSNGIPTIFLLQNTGVLTKRQSQTITLTHSMTTTNFLLTLWLETPSQASWRKFILGVFSDKGPFLLAITAIVSIAALILQEYQRQQAREKEERERKEREKQQEQEKQEQIQTQISQLRQHLIQVNPEGVKRIWKFFEDNNLPETLLPLVELEWLTNLKQLSLREQNSLPPEDWTKEIQREWPAELVGALVCAEEEILRTEENRTIYQPIFRQIPLEKVSNVYLRNRFLRLWRDVHGTPLQSLSPQKLFVPDAPINSSHFKNLFPGFNDPFAHMKAEKEETTLYREGWFYRSSPLFDDLLSATENQVVYGSSGSGLTALAKGPLFEDNSFLTRFWIYTRIQGTGERAISSILELLVRALLDYITQKPTLLSDFQEEQRTLLATVLAQTLTSNYVCSIIAGKRKKRGWAESADTDEQKQIWSQVGDTQLHILSNTVESITETQHIPEANILLAINGCFESLSFGGVRLLLDFAGNSQNQVKELIPRLSGWQNANVIATIFISNTIYEDITEKIDHMQVRQLAWSKDDLQNLLGHRFQKSLGIESPSDHYFPDVFFRDEQAYDAFLDQFMAHVQYK